MRNEITHWGLPCDRRLQFAGRLAALVLACLAVGGAAFAAMVGPARAAARLSWSAPVLVDDAPPFQPGEFGSALSVSCPSVSLCVAFNGSVVTSRSPGAGRPWSAPLPVLFEGFSGEVSCPSVSLCVAAGG